MFYLEAGALLSARDLGDVTSVGLEINQTPSDRYLDHSVVGLVPPRSPTPWWRPAGFR